MTAATQQDASASTASTNPIERLRSRGFNGWVKGQSGNPAGRKPGSRQRITEAFLAALAKDFAAHKAQVFEDVRKKDPSTYLRVVAGLLPAQAELALHNAGSAPGRDLEAVQADIRAAIEQRAQQLCDERMTVATVQPAAPADAQPVDNPVDKSVCGQLPPSDTPEQAGK